MNRPGIGLAVLMFFVSGGTRLHAQLNPFAQFGTILPGQVRYLSGGALTAQNMPVRFKYLPAPGVIGHPATGFDLLDAHLSFVAVRQSNAESLLGMGRQSLRLYSFSILLDAPVGGKTNLLSGAASTGDLRGLLGSNVAAFQSRTDMGASLLFTSDFLEFPLDYDAGLTWVLTGVDPSLAISGTSFRPFTSGLTGNFSSGASPIASVPEGSTLWLFCAAGVPFILQLRRQQSQARSMRGASGSASPTALCSSGGSGSCSAL